MVHALNGPEAGPGESQPDDGLVWDLVERARAGDRQAFAGLYDRYFTVVHRYIFWRCGDRTLADDLTSETFVRALRAIRSFQYQGRDPSGWFVTIARNLLLDHFKSARVRLEVVTDDKAGVELEAEGPEREVLGRLAAAEAMTYVRRLSPEQQECIVLRIFEGLSIRETAERMGKTEGAVKALFHRAIRRLATWMPAGAMR